MDKLNRFCCENNDEEGAGFLPSFACFFIIIISWFESTNLELVVYVLYIFVHATSPIIFPVLAMI
jgi:hypothetical protein